MDFRDVTQWRFRSYEIIYVIVERIIHVVFAEVAAGRPAVVGNDPKKKK